MLVASFIKKEAFYFRGREIKISKFIAKRHIGKVVFVKEY